MNTISKRETRGGSGVDSMGQTTGDTGGTIGWRTQRISQRTLILIRWIATAGQLLAVLIVHYGIGFELPLGALLAVIGVSVLLNVAATVQGRAPMRLGERDAALYIAYDIVQLTVLLSLTGGILNPFSIMLLAPLTVSAAILSRRAVMLLTGLCLACISVLFAWHYPLPGPLAVVPVPTVYAIGIWLALSTSAIFVAAYVWQVAEDARRMEAALSATQLVLSREQRVSSLGALAAAAAHELGTPLGTIAIVARELERDLPEDSPYRDDVRLLTEEARRCRDILTSLARRPDASAAGDPFERLGLKNLIEVAAEPHRRPGIELVVHAAARDESVAPTVRRSPGLMHGLGNLLQNATQFAHSRVSVEAQWSESEITLTFLDDGPGFPSGLLGRLGEPYLSDRGRLRNDGEEGGLGLGIFIAKTLLENTGAQLAFRNSGTLGAVVVVRWPRHIFEMGTTHSGVEKS